MFDWQIMGHENILDFLEKSILQERLANAYLFYGPDHIGKSQVSQKFAKILFCINAQKPCEECVNCRQIESNIYPDIYTIKKNEDKKNISIEQIREMRERLFQGSFFNNYKIGIISDAEFLTDNAWNSLLKILEEPPLKTIIILIATHQEKIPATILSRCQKLKFSLVQESIIYDYLIANGTSTDKAEEIARISMGKPGQAKKFIENPDWFSGYTKVMKDYLLLFSPNEKLFIKDSFIEKIAKENNDKIFDFLSILIRDLILIKISPELIVNLGLKKELHKTSQNFKIAKLKDLLGLVLKFQDYSLNNINLKLLLENFIFQIQ